MELKRDPFLQNAIVRGGLHGRPSGNVAGVVYGAARTRTGKVVTARELVYPSNPKTAAQVLQRSIFIASLSVVRSLGADVWQNDWNRAIGQLPGFQSMMSIFLSNTDSSNDFSAPPDTPLGNLHYPATLTAVTGVGGAGDIDIAWSNELGDNGTNADILHLLSIRKAVDGDGNRSGGEIVLTETRASSPFVFATGNAAMDYVVCLYFEGQGAAEGLITQAKWFDVTTKA